MKKRFFFVLLLLIMLYSIAFILSKSLAPKLLADEVKESTVHIAGDEGELDRSELSVDESIEMIDNTAYIYLSELALQYNGRIPFIDKGRYWEKEFPVLLDGIDPEISEEYIIGLDSLGYVQWIYRNIFGVYDKRIENPSAHYSEFSVSFDNLSVGDIGMYHLDTEKNHYGVCIGFLDDKPLFSHCDSVPQKHYFNGGTRISYLKSAYDEFLNGSAPVDFRYFVRPDHVWEDLND